MRRAWMMAAAVFAAAGVALAQEPAPPKQEQPSQEKQPEKPKQPPSLDDLLGLDPAKPREGRPPAEDPAKKELERKLASQEASQAFLQAVRLMDETAVRLEQSRDTGLTTQRMQEEIVRKLEIMIANAQKQRQQRQQQSSSRNQDDPQSQPDQQRQQQQQEGEQASSEAAQDSQTPPGREKEKLSAEVAQGAAWGALPARMRDALLQGNNDKFSALYHKWTEAYYRRLAEEAGK